MKREIGFLVGVLLLAGCATAHTLDDTRQKAPDRVISEVYPFSFEEVYTAARRSCLDLELGIEREDPKTGILYATSSPNMAKVLIYKTGFGEHLGIYLSPDEKQGTRVDIVTQKSNRLEIGYKDYRRINLKLIRARLEGNK